ncbi:MAG: hypothetical protein ACOC5E_03195 [Acidobacteriota bacterium]
MRKDPIALELPLPPAVNARSSYNAGRRHQQKNAYRRSCWMAAIEQAKPVHEPPARVRIEARFYLRNLRDPDKLKGSLDWVLDALKREQSGRLHWRQGVYLRCGFFVDDDPRHVEIAEPLQQIDRRRPRLEVVITRIEESDHV